ncbi:MAG TPA: 16S rRNA (cytosine(967)-C(5))-methyltransferase RsmB [Longimicrobiaceae bacterium]|nr:16S rRNA (cytosine(967)-C(5))-methyltransferase RsmB [Longimicrobiaceae bacterium]
MREKVSASRVAALEIMRRLREGDLADRAMDRLAGSLDPRDRAWLQELVYGTIRLRGRIDYLLDSAVRDGTASLEPDVLDVLRLGTYQLLEMGGVPAYAAISQSVELVRVARVGRAAGLVNGVLRTLRRTSADIRFPDESEQPVDYLSTWGSHPRWLVERWIQRYGSESARLLVEANNLIPELYIRPIGISRDEAHDRLAAAGIGSESVSFAPDSLRILPPASAREALAAVPAVVQDPAASLVTRFANVPSGATVIDLCAAPGGKAVILTENSGYVAAADRSVRRMSRLRENAERTGSAARMGLVVADGRFPPFRPVDFVLLDAPCTGTGTLRRHPDGRWRLTPDQLVELVDLQRVILDAAASLVRPGGLLIYSTCSLEPEENEMQVQAFISRHGEFAGDEKPADIDASLVDSDGYLRVLPQQQGADGSFAARLRRAA